MNKAFAELNTQFVLVSLSHVKVIIVKVIANLEFVLVLFSSPKFIYVRTHFAHIYKNDFRAGNYLQLFNNYCILHLNIKIHILTNIASSSMVMTDFEFWSYQNIMRDVAIR